VRGEERRERREESDRNRDIYTISSTNVIQVSNDYCYYWIHGRHFFGEEICW
jgi:hypothetical protein